MIFGLFGDKTEREAKQLNRFDLDKHMPQDASKTYYWVLAERGFEFQNKREDSFEISSAAQPSADQVKFGTPMHAYHPKLGDNTETEIAFII